MEPIEYLRIYYAEDQHWWYQGMAKITRAILDRYLSPTNSMQILDAGCGTGAAMATYLANYGSVTGLDLSLLGLRYCRERNLSPLIQASIEQLTIRSASFHLITSFDVLYSVSNDSQAMNEFFRILEPGGHLLVRLPAYDWLRGSHDKTVHTIRRYTIHKVKRLLANSSFQTIHLTYANTFLFPFAVMKRLSESIWPATTNSSDLSFNVGFFNGILKKILESEALLASSIGLPYGLSIFALAQKPSFIE